VTAPGAPRNRPKVPAAGLTIRPATGRESGVVWTLLMGLAVYERLRRQVKATPARLRRHGFGRRPYFKSLICRRGSIPIGVAVYFLTYSTFMGRPTLYIEDIFVLPSERGRGAGKAMLRALARIAVREQCGRMEWNVLRWNRPAIGFYRRLGARPLDDWVQMRLRPPAIRRLAVSDAGHGRAGSARPRRPRPPDFGGRTRGRRAERP
jgi:GNAT superfamily N-acetyltransferase